MEGALTIYLSSPSSTQPLRHRKLTGYTGIISTVEEIIIAGMDGGGFLQSSHPDIVHLLYINSDVIQTGMVDDDVVLDELYKYQYQYHYDSLKTRGEKIDIDGMNWDDYYEYTYTHSHKHSKSIKDPSNQLSLLGSVGMIIAASVSMMVGIAIGVRQKSTNAAGVDDAKNVSDKATNGDIESHTHDLGDASISANEFNSTNGQSGN